MAIDFPYCLSVNEGLLCKSVIGCLQGRMDIIKVLRAAFAEEELERDFKGSAEDAD